MTKHMIPICDYCGEEHLYPNGWILTRFNRYRSARKEYLESKCGPDEKHFEEVWDEEFESLLSAIESSTLDPDDLEE